MATTVSELQVVVSADTSKAESGLSALGGKLGSVGAGIATAFGGAAIAGIAAVGGALAASTSSAAGFEKQMSAIKAVSGATQAEMQQLSSLAMQLGADTSFSASEAAKGIEELIKAGVSVADVMGGGAAAALSLAAAGGLSVAESAEIASNAMNVFSLKGSDVGHVADVIAGAANSSAIDVHDFGMSLAASGAVAATVGVGFDDLATAIAVMGQAGIKGSDAGTSLKTMLLNLTPASKGQIAVARELGILTADGANKFFDASGKAKSLAEISEVLQQSTSKLTEQQKLQALQTLFGTDAIRAAAIMAKAGAEGFNEMAESIGKVTAEAVAQERLNNLAGSWEQFTGSLETAGITIGQHLLPGLTEITKWATEGLNSMLPALQKIGPMLGEAFSGGVRQAKDLLRQLGDAYRTVIQVFDYDWEPSADIESIADAAGRAAMVVRDLIKGLNSMLPALQKIGPMLGEAFSGGVRQAKDLLRQLGDAYRTVIQVFDYDWEPSADIESIADAAGRAAMVVRDLINWARSLRDAMADNGALETFARTLETIKVEAAGVTGQLQDLSRIGIDTNDSLNGVSSAAKLLAVGFEITVLAIGQVADTFLSTIRLAVDFISVFGQIGRALAALASGDVPGFNAAMSNAAAAAADFAATGQGHMDRMVERFRQGFTSITGSAQASSPEVIAAVDGMGAGMVASLEATAPQMAAAAESGASQAVAAVDGQAGAASAAGTSVGANLGDGLIGGIRSRIGGIIAAARSMISAALGAANDEAIIESPSKKTMYMGQMLDEGLVKGIQGGGPAVEKAFRDLMSAVTDYAPVAKEIARVENEIKDIREKAQTDALFRAKEMVTIDSESLRLKQAAVRLERDLIPLRQDLARATREVSDIERGSLSDRTTLIEQDGKRKELRLQQIELEKQLIGLDSDSKRAESIQKQIDRLRDQDRLLALESERISVTNSVAATNARIRKEALDDQARGQDAVVNLIKEQIEVLGGEQAVFQANENVIKNATDNEIAYRNQLIAVFKSEAAPLQDRITAGLALIDQLEAEGKIGEEVAKAWREVVKQQIDVKASTAGVGAASAAATPAISAAAQQAEAAAKAYQKMAEKVEDASGEVSVLAKSLGKLPDWFIPKGGSNLGSVLFPPGRAAGGDVTAGTTYLVGERGPELFTPSTSGTIVPNNLIAPAPTSGSGASETLTLNVAIGGKVAEQIVIQGYDLAVKRGWTPSGLTG